MKLKLIIPIEKLSETLEQINKYDEDLETMDTIEEIIIEVKP